MTNIEDIFDPQVETPEYERFIALNIQVPQVKGKRSYHRVTISSSLKDLGEDLSLVLPGRITKLLGSMHLEHRMAYKQSRQEIDSPNPKRDPYVAVCSCGNLECEHIAYALGHFRRILIFSQNSAQIAQQIASNNERSAMAGKRLAELQDRLSSLRHERDTLATSLKMADRDAQLVSELQGELAAKEDDIELLSLEVNEEKAEVGRYKLEIETLQENLRAMSMAWLRSGEQKPLDKLEIPEGILSVVRNHFMPRITELRPEEKFQDNVDSDHHRVANTHQVLLQLAQLEFVRELGISYRRQTKSGKVQVMENVDTLEVLVPHNGEADIIRVITMAGSKPQQMIVAYMVAERFDLDVQF